MPRKRVFISHCENNMGPTDYAIRIIDLIGCIPVITEREPKLSRSVSNLVSASMDSCDAVVVIATPDGDGTNGKGPSQGVLVEIGQLQKIGKFNGKYFIIKEESVSLSPMIPEARYKFSRSDYAPIAEAILIELGSMDIFRNYFELPGSDYMIHELMGTLSQLKDLRKKGALTKEQFIESKENLIRTAVEEQTTGVL